MLIEGSTIARFIERVNRFCVSVLVRGERRMAHLPNSGRLTELLVPGRRVVLVFKSGNRRITNYDLILVRYGRIWVSVDARLPPPLFVEALSLGKLSVFKGYRLSRREIPYGRSRLDLALSGPQGDCLIETKSVTLVRKNVALFPDAPTLRGRRHLEELTHVAQQGIRSAVVFVVQRSDAEAFSPHREADPAFADTLAWAIDRGVEVYAYACHVGRHELRIWKRIPVRVSF